MNPFEKANLERLANQSEEYRQIRDLILQSRERKLKEVGEESLRLIVRILFDIHSADLVKIKEQLRGDSEIIKGLNLEKIVNDEYQRQNNPKKLRARYDEQTQAKFWATVLSVEAERSRKLNGAA